jgi:hypothetical protein
MLLSMSTAELWQLHRRRGTPTHAPSDGSRPKLSTSLQRISPRRSPTTSPVNSPCPPLPAGAASPVCRFVTLDTNEKPKSSCTMNCPVLQLSSGRRCGRFICSLVYGAHLAYLELCSYSSALTCTSSIS